MLPTPVVEALGGRKAVVEQLQQEASLARLLVESAAAIAYEEIGGRADLAKSDIIDQLTQLANECPGAGAVDASPVRAAAQAYKNAMRVVERGRNL
jgi:hypothetical protein